MECYVVSNINDHRRGPYTDTNPFSHQPQYSPFHQTSDMCATCHDVSNPVYSRVDNTSNYVLNELDTAPPDADPYKLFPVERTYSEWKMSAYNTPEGISGTNFGGNKSSVTTCQDCHMPDITGKGANSAPTREDLGKHELAGGNTFIPGYIKATYSSDLNHPEALDSVVARAPHLLKLAASLEATVVGNLLTVTVINETAHKLPSGYPEGRRIWLNIRAFDAADALDYESGVYDLSTGILTHDDDVKIYEIKPGLSHAIAAATGLTAGPSFHFVLNDTIYSDNRIPPRGFTNANFEMIQSPSVDYSYGDGQYNDVTVFTLPQTPDSVAVTLYYQTTSKKYVEFLRDENGTDTKGTELYNYWSENGKSAPVEMSQVTLGSDDIQTSINEDLVVQHFMLLQNYPNPFNPQTTIPFILHKRSWIDLKIYNTSGQFVKEFQGKFYDPGRNEIVWDGTDKHGNRLSSGLYVYHN